MNKLPAVPTNDFIQYLAGLPETAGQLPSLLELSKELGLSLPRLREQVEVAKAIGLVKIRPHTGMERLEYSFLPPVRLSLAYAIQVTPDSFQAFADLRNHIEAAYWDRAVRSLAGDDLVHLKELIQSAWNKLQGTPVQIPHSEHRELHLLIYRRLENPFVMGILAAYWDAYESVGLNLYADYRYLLEVWSYHQQMVDAICAGEFEQGYQALMNHKDLLHFRADRQEAGNKNDGVIIKTWKKE